MKYAILAALTMLATCWLTGCEGMSKILPGDGGSSTKTPDANKVAYVKLVDPESGAGEAVTVTTRSTSSPSGRAVKHLQNEDYELSRQTLADAITAGDKTYETLFAYAVTLEKLGQYQPALENYKAANIVKSTPDASSGRKRCQAALGIGESSPE